MKERPIIFSSPMVQAILEGRKTQTRRVWKEPKALWKKGLLKKYGQIMCPYGSTGDQLWVRETWCHEFTPQAHAYKYKADEEGLKPFRWHPSIHMRKIAARIWLEIQSIRVERLGGISEEDAIAEGVKRELFDSPHAPNLGAYSESAISLFQSLWDSIHGSESFKENPLVWVITFKVLSTTGRP